MKRNIGGPSLVLNTSCRRAQAVNQLHDTLAGTKAAGKGTATISLTGTVAACLNGSVGIDNDMWDGISTPIVAATVTVNGVACLGGVDVLITGTSLSE